MLSFKEMYESYAPDVYRFSLWLSGSRFWAEDITSDTFIRAWTHYRPIRTETLKAYLFTIARNLYLSQLRKDKRLVDLSEEYPDPMPEPDQAIDLQLEIQRVQVFLQTLPEIDRSAFILRVQGELPYAEIARILELSLGACKVKVHRVRKKLGANFINGEV
ncbi:MAG: RNA polymerase sigma factor [Anaerolineales bacterium]